MRKLGFQLFKRNEEICVKTNTVLHKNFIKQGDPNYVGIFPQYIRMALIITDFIGFSPLKNCIITHMTCTF